MLETSEFHVHTWTHMYESLSLCAIDSNFPPRKRCLFHLTCFKSAQCSCLSIFSELSLTTFASESSGSTGRTTSSMSEPPSCSPGLLLRLLDCTDCNSWRCVLLSSGILVTFAAVLATILVISGAWPSARRG